MIPPDVQVPRLLHTDPVIHDETTFIYQQTFKGLDSRPIRVITRDGPPVVCVVPFLTPDTILLIYQYRMVWQEWSLEIPCGHTEPGEEQVHAAHRELEEETGYKARSITPQFSYRIMASSPQTFHLYYATDLLETKQNLDPTEQIIIKPTTLQEVNDLLQSHAIKHAPSILALQHLLLQHGP